MWHSIKINAMLLIDKDYLKAIKEKNVGLQELAEHLVRNNTVYDLAMRLAEYMLKDTPQQQKITVSEEEYGQILSLFKIRGVKDDGSAETRGRKKKEGD